MNRINIRTNYEGVVKTRKDGHNLIVMFPDGSSETVEFNDARYDRFFNLLQTDLLLKSSVQQSPIQAVK